VDKRPAPSVQSAAALVALILLAFIALGYALRNGVLDPVLSPERGTEPGRTASRPPTGATAPRATRRLGFPLAGFEHALRDNFDERRGARRHAALDIMAPRGTPVLAVDDGRIAKLYRGPMAGISVYQFDPGATRVYFYAHLDRYAPGLAQGREVERGDLIGYVGSTGNAPSHAPHLHFAMHELGDDKRWWKGKAVNPYALLRPGP
jgi:murein DD-endopeptidase MepM/ murein hydrolase activator NlpD